MKGTKQKIRPQDLEKVGPDLFIDRKNDRFVFGYKDGNDFTPNIGEVHCANVDSGKETKWNWSGGIFIGALLFSLGLVGVFMALVLGAVAGWAFRRVRIDNPVLYLTMSTTGSKVEIVETDPRYLEKLEKTAHKVNSIISDREISLRDLSNLMEVR